MIFIGLLPLQETKVAVPSTILDSLRVWLLRKLFSVKSVGEADAGVALHTL